MSARVRRRRALALGALAALAGAAGGLLDRGASPPADRAAGLVPAGALAYVHASTDAGRDEDRRLLRTLRRFDAVRELERRLTAALSTRAGAFDLERDVGSWLGDEAAVALVDRGGPAAATLILLAVEREATAQGVLTRVAGAEPAATHRGTVVRRFGGVAAAFVGGFLAVGQEEVVRAAIDLHAGSGSSLAADAGYAAAAEAAPDERSLTAWAPATGLRRVLAAQPGALGAIGAALDAPGLRGTHASVAAADDGIRVSIRRLGAGGAAREFEPELLDGVPPDAIAYAGLRGPGALAALLPAGLLAPLTEAAGGLDPAALLRSLQGEVAISVARGRPGAPEITFAARTSDARATREALGRLRGAVAELLAGSEDETGQVPVFEERDVGGGVTAYGLRLAQGTEVLYAVAGDRLVVSTAQAGLRAAIRGERSLRDTERFRSVVDRLGDRVEALGFFDLGQLLALGDMAGLSAGKAYRAARDDLRRIRALGAVARRQGNDTTAELHLQIP